MKPPLSIRHRCITPVAMAGAALAAALASWVPAVGAQCEVQKLTAPDGVRYDLFGQGVAICGGTIGVGAQCDRDNGAHSGSAWVFVRGAAGWVPQGKLLPGDGEPFDSFGQAIALSGDAAVVGAPYDQDNGHDSGSAYVFGRQPGGWVQRAKLLADDGAADDRFGTVISCTEDAVLVGAPARDDNGPHSGAAYTFARRSGAWCQRAKLLPHDGAPADH